MFLIIFNKIKQLHFLNYKLQLKTNLNSYQIYIYIIVFHLMKEQFIINHLKHLSTYKIKHYLIAKPNKVMILRNINEKLIYLLN